MPEYKYANKYKVLKKNDVETWLSLDEPRWVKALLIFLYLYGVRIGEALMIKREDLYELDEYLYLMPPETALLKNQDPYPRHLPLSIKAPGMSYLRKYQEDLEPQDLLFPYSDSYCWKRIHRVDPELSAHVFRHNRLTEFFLQDATEVEVQVWAGHSDTRQASNYRHRSGILSEKLGKKTKVL